MIQPLFSSQPNPHLHPRVAALRSSSSRPRHGSHVIPEEDYSMGAFFDYAVRAIHQAMKNRSVREPSKVENVVMTVDVETVDVIPQNLDLFEPPSSLKSSSSLSSMRSKSYGKSRSGGHAEFKRTLSRTSLNGVIKSDSSPFRDAAVHKTLNKKKSTKFLTSREPEKQSQKTKITHRSMVPPGSPGSDYFEAIIQDALEERKMKRSGSESSHEKFVFGY